MMSTPRMALIAVLIGLPLLTIGCSGPAQQSAAAPTDADTTPTLTAAPTVSIEAQTTASMAQHPAWIMASNCFQCHGTDGSGGFERLKGMSTREFIEEMKELQTETDSDEAIMKVHALAYTDAEIAQMADYFNKAR